MDTTAYQVYHYSDEQIIVDAEFDSLLNAYQSIDKTCRIFYFRQYYQNLFENVTRVNDLLGDYVSQVNDLFDQLESVYNATRINNLDVIKVLISTLPITDEDSDAEVNKKVYLLVDNEYYLTDLNAILEDSESLYYIRKNPNFVVERLKSYFKNHIQEYLKIVDILIQYNYYTVNPYRKKSDITIKVTDENNNEVELIYDDNYNEKDVYAKIEGNYIFSADEATVIDYFIQDIDLIVSIFVENMSVIINSISPLSEEVKSILR